MVLPLRKAEFQLLPAPFILNTSANHLWVSELITCTIVLATCMNHVSRKIHDEPHLSEVVCKATHGTICTLVNTRPNQLHWGDGAMDTGILCKKGIWVAGLDAMQSHRTLAYAIGSNIQKFKKIKGPRTTISKYCLINYAYFRPH